MSILILAEHNNFEVKSSTLNTISAASKVGSEIDVLVVGSDIENISKEISNYQNVSKVISLDRDQNSSINAKDVQDKFENRFLFKNIKFSQITNLKLKNEN